MIACFDVHYDNGSANAAGIMFHQWHDEAPADQLMIRVSDVGDYQAGSFYKRELKPLRELLPLITYPIQYFVIDAYCHLSEDDSPGLGAYLYELLPVGSIVIGVAKNRFRNTSHAFELFRGSSSRPLFITSIGMDYQCAAAHVQSMAGNHRIPTLLKTVDRLSRSDTFSSSI
ncbi:MAG TPA: hypothetical protein V6D20_02950 [Candidatus Obscuribacterales bacterium]